MQQSLLTRRLATDEQKGGFVRAGEGRHLQLEWEWAASSTSYGELQKGCTAEFIGTHTECRRIEMHDTDATG